MNDVERSFEQRGQTVRLKVPQDEHRWSDGQLVRHASHREALAAHLEAVDALIADGAFELSPTLRLLAPDGGAPLTVQLPSFSGFSFSSGERHAGGDLCAVVQAFQATLRARLAQGYRWESVPAWPGWYPAPPSAEYEEVETKKDGGRAHHFFRSRAKADDEFGPELHVGPEQSSYGYQFATNAQGPWVWYQQGRLAASRPAPSAFSSRPMARSCRSSSSIAPGAPTRSPPGTPKA